MALGVDAPILLLGCHHHISELHIKRLIQEVMGATKDPGVPLFCRLKSEWYSLDIDYRNLSKLDLSVLPEWMKQEGKDVLSWALQELDKNTWPREDY